MKAYTDYPFTYLGDEPYKQAPVRQVEIVSYDFNKHCYVLVGGEGPLEVKSGYLYKKCSKSGVMYIPLTKRDLLMLPSNREPWTQTYTDWLNKALRWSCSVHKEYNFRYSSFKDNMKIKENK